MIVNKAVFNAIEIKVVFGENSVINFNDSWTCSGVSTDTRSIGAGNLFLALKGENSDGHTRVKEALEKGASGVVIENTWYEDNKGTLSKVPVIVVKNTLHALGQLAAFHRKRFNTPIIAIGGANGKTTTKDMTAAVLSGKFNVLKTQENYNNQIGVPLMLLMLDNSYSAAVIEMGTNEPGEIAILCSILNPNHGLITNIGKEHLEKLIDLDGVEMEETFLYGYLHKQGGAAFINMDDERLKKYDSLLERKFTYGSDTSNLLQGVINLDEELHPIIEFKIGELSFNAKLRTQGYTTGLNAVAAAAVGVFFDIEPEGIKSALESFEPQSGHGYGRMLVERRGNVTIINDCYNANPDSMKAALNALKQMNNNGNKYAILGDMRELGDASIGEHIEILVHAAKSADEVLAAGSEMKKALNNVANTENIRYFNTKEELTAYLIPQLKDGDVVLVKGSRGMKMEEIVEKLRVES